MLSEITENGFNFNSAGEAFTLLIPQPRILCDIGAGDREGAPFAFWRPFRRLGACLCSCNVPKWQFARKALAASNGERSRPLKALGLLNAQCVSARPVAKPYVIHAHEF
jgi:hypothetical protein